MKRQKTSQETIVCIHGIARTKMSMTLIVHEAKQRGYNALNWHYPSRTNTTAHLADTLGEFLTSSLTPECAPVNFITHSLGGIVLVEYLKRRPKIDVGRIVLMAPPLSGSDIVDEAYDWPGFQEYFGPAIAELKTTKAHTARKLPYEVGVIAGNKPQFLLSDWFFDEPNDGKVSVRSTKGLPVAEHRTLPVTHTEMTFSPKVIDAALHFIEHGSFGKR